MKTVLSAAALALSLFASTTASAQGAPDVVRLKSGAIYKGTISELVPGDHVEIVVLAGEKKRFAFSEVEYAGADKAAAAPASAPEGGATLAFRGTPDLTLHVVTGSSYGVVTGYRISGISEEHSFKSLCTAPCTAQLAPGTYELALSSGDGKPIIARRVVVPSGPSQLNGEYSSRAGLRTAGIVVLIAGLGTGLTLMFLPLLNPSEDCSKGTCTKKFDFAPLFIGTGIVVASSIVGTILATRPDRARVELVPGVTGLSAPPALALATVGHAERGTWATAKDVLPTPGLSLRVTF